MTDHRMCKCGHVEAEHYVLAEACAKCDCSEFIRLPAEALTEAVGAREIFDRAVKRPYTFSWYQRETAPAPRTWRDRILFRRPTMFTWRRHVVVLHTAKLNVERFGGWLAILDAFLLPMIWAGAGHKLVITTQIEEDGGPQFDSTHADRGDGKGPV